MKVTVKRKDNSIPVVIGTEFIKLESAMKLANIVISGGTAKNEIQEGYVTVNGEVCTMRGKKLYKAFYYGNALYLNKRLGAFHPLLCQARAFTGCYDSEFHQLSLCCRLSRLLSSRFSK